MFSKPIRLGLGLSLSGLTLFLVLHNVSLHEVGTAIARADARYVILALSSVAANTLAKVFRWRALLGKPGERIAISRLLAALLVGQMFNTLYPARIGDISRAYVIGGQGPGRAFTLGTVLIEKILDLLSYTLLFFLLFLLVPLPSWIDNSVFPFTLAVLLASAGVALLAYWPQTAMRRVERALKWLPVWTSSYVSSRFNSGLSSLEILQDRSGIYQLIFWSAVIWGTAILNNHLVLLALNIHLPLTASLLILMILQAGVSVPSVPGKIGIFEYSCLLALAFYGIAQAPALSYGILLHGVILLPTTILGFIFLWLMSLGGSKTSLMNSIRDSQAAGPDTNG